MDYKKHTLKNGLRVVFVPMKEVTTATALICVGTGSRFEDKHENGLAHFLEHMFFKGTKKRPKTMNITKELDALGSQHNAYTGKDRTGYYTKVPSNKIIDAMDVLDDLFNNATFKNTEIKKESGTIVQEINMYEDMPSRLVYDVFETLLYSKEHPLGREILGTKENVTSFVRKDFMTYLERCYTAQNTVVCVAGNFPQGKVLTKIRKDFGQMRVGDKPAYEIYVGMQDSAELKIKDKKTDQTHFMVGVHTGGFNHKDRYVLSMLANILGGGMSSRLWEEVREKRGLAYSVHALVDFYPETGFFAAKAGVEHENLVQTLQIILKEMKKIATSGVTKEEFDRARSGFEGRLAFSMETSDTVASNFAEQEAVRGDIIVPTESLKRINKVTRGDIQRVAKEIFVRENLNCAIIGPQKKNEKAIKNMLKF
ncbi:MAG: pitrilysin family protein [Patescibacteria group bacterium]|nr:pitrilysin family protein [Patescibacteria group bacterium]